MKMYGDNKKKNKAEGLLVFCKLLWRLIPSTPWWVFGRVFRMQERERDYDWSLRGMLFVPRRRGALIFGWSFWVVGIVLIAILVRHL